MDFLFIKSWTLKNGYGSTYAPGIPSTPRNPVPYQEDDTDLFIDIDWEGEWNCEVPAEEYGATVEKVYCYVHKWKKYTGILEEYYYCEICDDKRKEVTFD